LRTYLKIGNYVKIITFCYKTISFSSKTVFPFVVEIILTDVLLIDYKIENFEDLKMFFLTNK